MSVTKTMKMSMTDAASVKWLQHEFEEVGWNEFVRRGRAQTMREL